MLLNKFAEQLDAWGAQRTPFLFLVDFELKKPKAFRLDEVPSSILYVVNGITNAKETSIKNSRVRLNADVMPLMEFEKKFSGVVQHLALGDSYLTNLTIRTRVMPDRSLRDLFFRSKARYKLFLENEFLVFSPEIFVQIRDGKIFSYPMKGTIDASLPGAQEKILADQKELAEHVTIVDLIRNDLSTVAERVRVSRFRYIDEITTHDKRLLQVSSEIVGELSPDYHSRLGTILINLLPAGSVSGAPKPKTMEIIRQAEGRDRGYYTGVFGIFDGKNFDSGVMIRYIEQEGEEFYYRSGGGITTQSEVTREYQEAIDKIYVPVD
jgi:para-aminobenzoate synthetase component 1